MWNIAQTLIAYHLYYINTRLYSYCISCLLYKKACSYLNKILSDENLGTNLRVTGNRCVLCNPSTCMCAYVQARRRMTVALKRTSEGVGGRSLYLNSFATNLEVRFPFAVCRFWMCFCNQEKERNSSIFFVLPMIAFLSFYLAFRSGKFPTCNFYNYLSVMKMP